MNNDCHLSPKEFLGDNQYQDDIFENFYYKNEKSTKTDFKRRITETRAYLDDLKKQCEFSNLSKQDLFKKVIYLIHCLSLCKERKTIHRYLIY